MAKSAISKIHLRLLMLLVLVSGETGFLVAQENQDWVSLFNGKDIKDWVVKINHHNVGEDPAKTFRAEDGIIKVRYDKYDSFNQQYGHLYYKQPFSYYRLRFEYRISGEWRKDAPSYTIRNSGV